MVGTTLLGLRERIESLASDDGSYYVVCGRTGERPVPAAGHRFDSRTAARSGARAAEQYRRALRRYDPRLPCYDLIVCEESGPLTSDDGPLTRHDGSGKPAPGEDRRAPPESARRRRVEFSHRVAGALFETLSSGKFDGVETAVMDAYFELAETVADPDDLCLCLLESLATEFDERLSPQEQATVLAGAAAQLPSRPQSDRPVSAALRDLREYGLVETFRCAPATVDLASGTRSVLVTLSDYALSPRDGRLPVLPLVVGIYRHRPRWSPAALRVVAVDEGWRVTVELGATGSPDRLACVPVEEPV